MTKRAKKCAPGTTLAVAAGSALLPCPCCGRDPVTGTAPDWQTDDRLLAYILCRGCGLQTALHSTTDEALALWNRRVPPNSGSSDGRPHC